MKKYYDIEANWWKLRQFYESGNVRDIWWYEMMAFLKMQSEDSGIEITPPKNMKACHHLVHLNHWVSVRAEPDMHFKIISINHNHSTLYSEEYQLLWDLNFLAFGIPAEQCYQMATSTSNLI